MKYLFTILTLTAFLTTTPLVAQGIRQAPGTTPLQPAPQDVRPNYTGNIQSGDGVERAQQGLGPTYDEIDQTEDVGGPGIIEKIVGAQDGSVTGIGLATAIAIVFLSACIAGAYYWYKTRKTQ